MITRYYYEFWELSGDSTKKDPTAAASQGVYTHLSALYLIATGVTKSLGTDTTYTTKLFSDYIYPHLYEDFVMYIDVEHDPWVEPTKPLITSAEFKAALLSWIGKVYAWIHETQPVYEKLIALYEGQSANLLNKIESTSLSKYNDTPQDGGNFDTDTHTTNSTRNVSATDGDTLMARLDEIRKRFVNLYSNWAAEFSRLVVIYNE